MRWFHKLGLRIVDLLILSLAILFITSSAISRGDFRLISIDFAMLLLVVFVTYVAVVVLVSVLTMSIPDAGMFARFAKAAIAGLLVFFMFPYIVNWLMLILGYQLTTDVQGVLMVVAVLRAVVGGLLGRRLGGGN